MKLPPIEQSALVATDLLAFDLRNPRFIPNKKPDGVTDEDIIRFFDRTADLGELIESMSANGYIKIEPMIVYENNGELVVLEGNRRLAALKCLRDTTLARRIGVDLPEISSPNRVTLNEVSVWRVEDRASARDLIGYKHINGPQSWDAYAKALFAMQWFKSEKSKPNGMSFREIAKKMGDQHDTLRRMVTAAFVIEQANDNNIWSIDQRKNKYFSFSRLYAGLSYGEFVDYLGMKHLPRSEDPALEPVPKEKHAELSCLLSWLYGNKAEEEDPVICSQAEDLKKLRKVLGNKAATSQLVATRRLDDAAITATSRSVLFAQNVYKAELSLTAALKHQRGFEPRTQSELIDTLNSIRDNANDLMLLAENKMKSKSK